MSIIEPSRHNTRHDPYLVAEKYRGIYAHAVESKAGSRLLHVSGQIGVSPSGRLPGSFEGQCHQALNNLEAVLGSAAMSFADLVKVTFFLTRTTDMDALVAVRRQRLEGARPAVTTLFVAGLVDPAWFVEIEAVAAAETS